MAGKRRFHQQASKSFMTVGVKRETDIRTAPVFLWIINTAVGINLQHVGRSIICNTDITTSEAGPLEFKEKAG